MVVDAHIDPLFYAAVEATEAAIVNALLAAETMTGRDGDHGARADGRAADGRDGAVWAWWLISANVNPAGWGSGGFGPLRGRDGALTAHIAEKAPRVST